MTHTNDATRKAAILVSALDVDAADALLDQMPPQFADQVRAQLMELDAIDDGEEQRVISQFLGNGTEDSSVENGKKEFPDQPVSLEEFLSAASQGEAPAPGSLRIEETESSTPFEFLHENSADQIFSAIRGEQPQAIAVVLSHVTPPQAAAVLAMFDADTQVRISQRMVALDGIQRETLREIEEAMKHVIEAAGSAPPPPSGLTAMRNILAASHNGSGEVMHNLQQADAALARRLNAAEGEHESARSKSTLPYDTVTYAESKPQQPMAEVVFDDLTHLSDADLGRVLREAEGRVLLLALAGASGPLMEKVYSQLPRAEATALQRQIEQQGPITLRDVEEAQRRISKIAGRLAAEGKVRVPAAKRFAFAA